ncbi:Haloalkane dehalogenase [Rosistilla oblonga]|uniref:alpha/beta fold hydrolase n=1 Tax=Rosistilla oblonga TaxID=2527990 RepID=UPI00118AF4ED|nr:alpha/beta fold hydrolase [Rosistilla oblonga]QDV12191.1 Haloalkane dehalogenase [Rosistilla oblonga]
MNSDAIWQNEYPFTSRWHEADGHRYHFISEGAGDQTILAVHGNPTWSFYWRNVVQRFSDSRRVVAVDHIGCGMSDKPQEYDYCLETHAANLGSLIEAEDLRQITLLAHDWGGAIGLLALTKHVDRFERIVLLNTGAFPPPYVPWRIGVLRCPVLGPLAIRGLNAFAGPAVTMAMSRRSLSPEARAGLLAPYKNWADRVAIDRFVQDIPMSPSHRTWQPLERLEAALPSLSHLPTMLIWGMKDWCFRPECMDRIKKSMPHAQTVPIADAGHYVMEDATEEVLDSIGSFFQSTDAPSATSATSHPST